MVSKFKPAFTASLWDLGTAAPGKETMPGRILTLLGPIFLCFEAKTCIELEGILR